MPPSGWPPQRILIVRLHGLGDVLMITPAIRAMRLAWPRAKLVAVVGRAVRPSLAGNPHLDEIIPIAEEIFFQRRPLALLKLALALRARRFELGVVFSRSRALQTFAKLAGCQQVVSLKRLPPNHPAAIADWRATRYQVEEHLQMLAGLGVAAHGLAMDFFISAQAEARAAKIAPPEAKWAVMAPGGGVNAASRMVQRRWPAERFASLAEALHQVYGLRTIIVGSPGDSGLAQQIIRLVKSPVADATAEDRLDVTAALIRRSRLLVCNDSVAMHLGLIVGTPTVAIFGPSNHQAVLPPGQRLVRVVRAGTDCSPCFWQAKPGIDPRLGRGKPLPCGQALPRCLEEISLEMVLRAAESCLTASPDY